MRKELVTQFAQVLKSAAPHKPTKTQKKNIRTWCRALQTSIKHTGSLRGDSGEECCLEVLARSVGGIRRYSSGLTLCKAPFEAATGFNDQTILMNANDGTSGEVMLAHPEIAEALHLAVFGKGYR